MTYAFLAASVLLFMVAIKVFSVLPKVQGIVASTRSAVAVMRSTELSEEQKEEQIQKAAIAMFAPCFSVIVRILGTIAVPVIFVTAPTYFGLYTADEVYAAAGNWIFIVVSSVAMIGLWIAFK